CFAVFSSAASMIAVPLHVATKTSCAVPKSVFRSGTMRVKSARNSALRCPIIGRVISCRIAGRTQAGPGIKYLQTIEVRGSRCEFENEEALTSSFEPRTSNLSGQCRQYLAHGAGV